MQFPLAPARLDLARLGPSSFAFVMATGIVGVTARMHHLRALAWILFGINVAAWLVLTVLHALRIALHPRDVAGDLQDHARSPGFFTWVAGTAVLASEFLLFRESVAVGAVLAAAALLLWLGLTYAVFTALTIRAQKPALEAGLNGSWLLAVVALQSLAVVGTLLSAHAEQPLRLYLNFAGLSLWLFAGALYTWLATLIFYRLTFLRFAPGDLQPPFWINMGAMAISALAGTQLVANAAQAPFLGALLPFLKGFTLLYWATGTWWIPLLVVLAVWRHGVRGEAVRWNPLVWAAVFPLGMYSAATTRIAEVMELPFLQPVGTLFLWLAIAAWSAAVAVLAAQWVGRRPVTA
jgi:tellurite resistance protein TehA-like permease